MVKEDKQNFKIVAELKEQPSSTLDVEFVLRYVFGGQNYLVKAVGTKECFLLPKESAPRDKRGVQSVKKDLLKAVTPQELEFEVPDVSKYFDKS